ncbi:hypothetical protein BDR26DRAFT_849435 [Obelidium mucronatum]|nr:hypothetical protein BDR26DRAFT_849435 [Obelidium mucronatum]
MRVLPRLGTKSNTKEESLDWGRLKTSGVDMRGGVNEVRNYSAEEIARHRKKDDLWMVLHGKVYCCTKYVSYHPGGITQLLRGAGIDATDLFLRSHPWVDAHSSPWRSMSRWLLLRQTKQRSTQFPRFQFLFFQWIPTGLSPEIMKALDLNSTIIASKELQNTSRSLRSTHYVEISVAAPYSPGDYLEVYPQNDTSATRTFVVTKANIPENHSVAVSLPLNKAVTLRYILTHKADLSAPLSSSFLSLLSPKLSNLGCGKILNPPTDTPKPRSLLDIISMVPIAKAISLKELFCVIPAMTPRRYSISSSPLSSKESVSITVAVLQDRDSETGMIYPGLCSTFLALAQENFAIRCQVLTSQFHLPDDLSIPLVLICAGSGIAPFMGFLQHMAAARSNRIIRLYFGCRDENDFLYRRELHQFLDNGVLSALRVAHSRQEQERKAYVQDLLIEDSATIWELVENSGGMIYICGAVRMANGVRTSFGKLASSRIHQDLVDAWIQNHCVEDVWG